MKMPFGPEWFKGINWNIPNAVQAHRARLRDHRHHAHEADHPEQGRGRDRGAAPACIEAGVNLIGCQMTVDLFGFTHEDFIPEVKEYCGAATFLPMARDADVSLFI